MSEPVRWLEDHEKWTGPRNKGLPPGGGGGDNENMEARVRILEDAMTQVRQDVAVMRSNYATKEDLANVKAEVANAKASIIMWVVGAIIFAQVLPALPGIFRAFGWIQ